MKVIFVIAIVFAFSVCEVTSLECYQCSYIDENCGSPEKVRCREEHKFCGKVEYTWFNSLFHSEPPGHYIGKGCLDDCMGMTGNGYYWNQGTWITCCQGDYCN